MSPFVHAAWAAASDADIVEDRNVTATGTYSATATQTAIWLMQMTFKAAGQ